MKTIVFVLAVAASLALPLASRAGVVTDPLEATTGFPSNPQGAIDAARQRVAAGDLPGAIRALSLYVAVHPREAAPARFLGDLYYRSGDLAQAERTYAGILQKFSGDSETHNRLGALYAREDRINEAIDEFTHSLPAADSIGALVTLHRRKGDLPAFEAQFVTIADASPFDGVAQAEAGALYLAEHRAARAVSYLERAVLRIPHCGTLNKLGIAYMDLGRRDDAKALFERCLKLEGNDYSALVNLSALFLDEGYAAGAKPYLDSAYREAPERPEAVANYGYYDELMGNPKAAMRQYLQAIALDPARPEPYVNLGTEYAAQKFFDLAEASYLKGLAVAPDWALLHYMLARAYNAQHKVALAAAQYREAARSDDLVVAQAAKSELASLEGGLH